MTGVELSQKTMALSVGGSKSLTATVKPEDATNKSVSWASDKDGVAAVDQAGKVTAKAVGSAKITVTTGDGGKTATCTVTVSDSLRSASVTGEAKVGAQLTASVEPSGATATWKWKRADSADGAYSDIAGATAATYTPVEEDLGKFLKAEATGTGGYTGTVLSSATAAVAAAG